MPECIIRPATPTDAQRLLEIYASYVVGTPISFEYDVPTLADFTGRIERISKDFPWLVCEVGGIIAGYAYASKYRERAAYRWSCEYSVYLDPSFHRMGIARALYTCLTRLLKLLGYVTAYACVTVPNQASESLHENFGFVPMGLFHNAGYKLGRWHNVKWFEMPLMDPPGKPAPPKPTSKVAGTAEYANILAESARLVKTRP